MTLKKMILLVMTMIKETWICNYYEISDVKPDNPEEAISDVDINHVNHVNVGVKHSVSTICTCLISWINDTNSASQSRWKDAKR